MATLTPEQDFRKEQEDKIRQQFSQGRLRLTGQQRRGERQLQKDIGRFSDISGVRTGAVQKARGLALQEAARQGQEAEAGLSAAESGALQQAAEASRGREVQMSQFGEQMSLMRKEFKLKSDLAWAEFNESVKANFINAGIAAKEAGLVTPDQWAQVFAEGSVMSKLFPGLADPVRGGRYVQGAITKPIPKDWEWG